MLGAFGYFEVTHDISRFSKAKVFEHVGKVTPIAVRFSTVGKQLFFIFPPEKSFNNSNSNKSYFLLSLNDKITLQDEWKCLSVSYIFSFFIYISI